MPVPALFLPGRSAKNIPKMYTSFVGLSTFNFHFIIIHFILFYSWYATRNISSTQFCYFHPVPHTSAELQFDENSLKMRQQVILASKHLCFSGRFACVYQKYDVFFQMAPASWLQRQRLFSFLKALFPNNISI